MQIIIEITDDGYIIRAGTKIFACGSCLKTLTTKIRQAISHLTEEKDQTSIKLKIKTR